MSETRKDFLLLREDRFPLDWAALVGLRISTFDRNDSRRVALETKLKKTSRLLSMLFHRITESFVDIPMIVEKSEEIDPQAFIRKEIIQQKDQ